MHRARGFTLIEIAISCFILMILMLLAIPSVQGVLKNRRLQRSLDSMNNLVRQAQVHSVE
ncbi:MAG: pilus assembly FimT family protein, partial [Chthoniobacterales bacterium]